MMKNAFYFTLKALFVFKRFNCLFWFFGHVVKGLSQKDKVNFKIFDVIIWLTNISRIKDNQAMKSDQLIAAPQGGFIAPHVWEIVCRKNLTIFKGCHYSRFYIMISLSFQKIETKNLNSDPRILIFLVLGTTSPAAH